MALFGIWKKSEQKIKEETRVSKNELIGFMSRLIEKTTDEGIKDDMRAFKRETEKFDACPDKRAITLDSRIKGVLNEFIINRFKVAAESSGKDNDNEVLRDIHTKGNKEMFDVCYNIIESQLHERKDLMGEKVLTKKEVKSLGDYERGKYLYRQKQAEILEDVWSTQGAVLDYTLRLSKLLFEKKGCQTLQKRLVEKAKTDTANKDSYARQFNVLQNQIENANRAEKIVAAEIEKNEKLKGIISLSDIEEMVSSNNSNSGTKVIEKIKSYSKRVKGLAAERKHADEMASEIIDSFDQTYKDSMPKQKSGQFDVFNSLVDASIMDDSLNEGTASTTENSLFEEAFNESGKNGGNKQ